MVKNPLDASDTSAGEQLPRSVNAVPTDDEDESDTQRPGRTPPARRLILLKRPNIPRGHSPPNQDVDELVSAPAIACGCGETRDPACSQCSRNINYEENSGGSSRSGSVSRAAEPAVIIEYAKTANGGKSGPALTLEEREQAYEEARRRIFGSPENPNGISMSMELLPPPPVRPIRPRPYRTPPGPSTVPMYPNVFPNPFPNAYMSDGNGRPFCAPFSDAQTFDPEIGFNGDFNQFIHRRVFPATGPMDQPPPPPSFMNGFLVSESDPPPFYQNWDAINVNHDPNVLLQHSTAPPMWREQTGPVGWPPCCTDWWDPLSCGEPSSIPPPPPFVNPSNIAPVHQSSVLASSRVGKMEPRNMLADMLDPEFDRSIDRRGREAGVGAAPNFAPPRTYDSDFPPLGRSPTSWSRSEEESHRRRSPSRRSSRDRRSRSAEPRRSRFSRRSGDKAGSRSPSHRRSSRRPNKSSDIEERRRSESSDRRQRDSAGGDRPDEKEEFGGNWWEHHPPYATRRAPSSRGRGRGGPWGCDPGRPPGTDPQHEFREGEGARFPQSGQGMLEHQGMPRPGLRPFEDGRPPYGRGEPGFGLRPPPAAWMAGFGMGAPAGWRGPQRFRNDGSGAPPPPPPSEGEPDESGSTTVQLRPRQVDSRGIRLTPAEEEWDKKLRAPGMVPTGRPGYPGIPRPMLPPVMWQQQVLPNRFGPNMDPNLLARQGRPPLLQQQRLPPGVNPPVAHFGASRPRRGRIIGGVTPQGPLMMLQQAAARRRFEGTDGRYLEAELETSVNGAIQLSPQDRQEEELVDELQTFLDLELSRGIKCHSFFSRVSDKLDECLLTNHTKTQINTIVPAEASFHPSLSLADVKVESGPAELSSEGKVLKLRSFMGVRRLFNIRDETKNEEPATKKRKHSDQRMDDFFPDMILSNSLANGIREMPFNILDESEQSDLREEDKDVQTARLRQFIAARRVAGSLGSSSLAPSSDGWIRSGLGSLPFSAHFPTSQCPTFPSIGSLIKGENEPLCSVVPFVTFGEHKQFDISNPIVSFPTPTRNLDPPRCLSSAFTCRMNSQNGDLEVVSFRPMPASKSDRIATNLLVEETLAVLIS